MFLFRLFILGLTWILIQSYACAEVRHTKVTKWLGQKPALINIITITPTNGDVVKPTYGEYNLNRVKTVRDFTKRENALAGINASYFKPDIGAPLGVSIINGEILTGPIYNRVVFGITNDNRLLMDKVYLAGQISIAENLKINVVNFNQPEFGGLGYTIFTDRWGTYTPKTSSQFCHVVVVDNKISYIKQSTVQIPKGGYVIVGPRWIIKDKVKQGDSVAYDLKLLPDGWENVKHAVGGGPYLVKDGQIFVDRQNFRDSFLWRKEPRTAVGYKKDGTIIFITVDGRKEGVSDGATLPELARLMWELGCYNAMNLDGGSSTQMVYNGKVVNMPTVSGGNRVTNALVVVREVHPAQPATQEVQDIDSLTSAANLTKEDIIKKIRQYEIQAKNSAK